MPYLAWAMGTSGARNPTLTVQALAWRYRGPFGQELEVDREFVI